MATTPKTAAVITPSQKDKLKSSLIIFGSSTKNAPMMAGVPSKNAKRADSSRASPISRLPVKTMPERETPGTNAMD